MVAAFFAIGVINQQRFLIFKRRLHQASGVSQPKNCAISARTASLLMAIGLDHTFEFGAHFPFDGYRALRVAVHQTVGNQGIGD